MEAVAVLHLLNGEQYSGLERMVDHLVAAAPTQGFRLVLALLKPDRMRQRMSAKGGEVHEVPMRSRVDLSGTGRITAIATAAGCRLIHSHTVRSALVARRIRRATGLPWVHHVHSPALHESMRVGMNLASYLAEAVVMRQADRVLTVSQALAGYVHRHYRVPEARITVVHNGVANVEPDAVADGEPGDHASFMHAQANAQANARANAQANAGNEHPFIILTVGLFRARKGIEHLVRAAGLLRDAGHDFRLRLAGEFADPGYEAAVRGLVAQLGLRDRVEFLGFVDRVDDVLQHCDVFALPSLKGEGMPMAVLEAMAHARPVVASDIDGAREILAGGAGLLGPPAEAGALADAIARLIRAPDLRLRLARAAQARQRRHYSLQAMSCRLFEGYRSLLAECADRPRTRRR